jgi:DNA-binding response OmpR family regulator
MKAAILLIEGKRSDHTSFGFGLQKKGYQVQAVPNGSKALECLEAFDPDLVVIDASSLRTSGRRICQSIRKVIAGLPIVLIADRSQETSEKSGADSILFLPFTIQKLVNRIKPLLPVEEKNLLHVGPIRLDLEQRRVRCMGKQSKLTPRLVGLLKILMEHRGEVIERENLFSQVWETQYTVDTRTLDVHVSWLREAIEIDPRRPRFLKTIRGVGYRLDV